METQYTHFNEFIRISEGLFEFSPEVVLGKKTLNDYIFKAEKPHLTTEEKRKISIEHTKLWILSLQTLSLDIIHEIDLNVAAIPSKEQLKRYLTQILGRAFVMLNEVKFQLCYDLLVISKINFLETVPKNSNMPEEEEVILKMRGRQLPTDENLVHDDIVSVYLHSCFQICTVFDMVFNYINEELNKYKYPQEKPTQIIHGLTAISHRLLLNYRYGNLKSLFEEKHNLLETGKFAHLVGTMLGVPEEKQQGFRKTLHDFYNETYLRPKSKKTVQTPAAERKVNAYLAELGLNEPEEAD